MVTFRRALLYGALALAYVAFIAAYSVLREYRSQASEFYDVGGYQLGVHCSGSGSPTVILEAGRNGHSGSWRKVQPAIDNNTRVCSYDRAGLGKSDDRPEKSVDALQIVEELHALLTQMREPGPYVFVGHSIGGLYVREYAERYPDDVAGFVFVDSSHEDQFERFGASYATFGNEAGYSIDLTQLIEDLQASDGYGDVPIVSIQARKIMNDTWLDLRTDLAEQSTNGFVVIADDSKHNIQKQQPSVVIRAIELVVAAAREETALPPCEDAFADLRATCP